MSVRSFMIKQQFQKAAQKVASAGRALTTCSLCGSRIGFNDAAMITSETPDPATAALYVKRLQALVGGSKAKAMTSSICFPCFVSKVKNSTSIVTMSQEEVKKATEAVERVIPAGARKIGRNEYCPCGSGKKYKKCCSIYDRRE